ncbi:hypothetical protein [Burkholderia ubonensis]|uniref:hypothetical protein n=1 Tax=Burkholderia ubonensis TaxID=101571 RepID=UPI0012F9B8B9|nr:hypothetical protein [Burkholderia ubonensis]
MGPKWQIRVVPSFFGRRMSVHFFEHAGRVTEREYSHDLVAANCYAEGKAHLVDGGTATWKIDQARRGFVSMPDGSTIYLYCPKCRANVFAPN